MKPLWFTVAVPATALAMAFAALPAFGGVGEEAPTTTSPLNNPLLTDPDTAPAQPVTENPIAPTPAKVETQPETPPPAPVQEVAPPAQPETPPVQTEIAPVQAEPPAQPAPEPVQTFQAPPPAPAGEKGLDWSASAALVTPLMGNTYDSFLKSFGLQALTSVALPQSNPNFSLRVEGGFGFMFSKFSSSFAGFNHVHFDFPLRLRLLYPLNDKGLIGEAYAGAVLRFFQYNDDPRILGGPLYKNTTGVFNPDIGVGVSLPFGAKWKARAMLSLVYFTLGAEYSFQ